MINILLLGLLGLCSFTNATEKTSISSCRITQAPKGLSDDNVEIDCEAVFNEIMSTHSDDEEIMIDPRNLITNQGTVQDSAAITDRRISRKNTQKIKAFNVWCAKIDRPIYKTRRHTFVCPIETCRQVFNTPSAVSQHKKRKHPKQHKFFCNAQSCNFVSSSSTLLRKHRQETHLSKVVICAFCKQGFASAHSLKSHTKYAQSCPPRSVLED